MVQNREISPCRTQGSSRQIQVLDTADNYFGYAKISFLSLDTLPVLLENFPCQATYAKSNTNATE